MAATQAPMKSLALLFCLLLSLGCSSCLRDGSSAIASTSGTVSYSSDTNTWSAGITITFKTQSPSQKTIAQLNAAGANRIKYEQGDRWGERPREPEVWLISRYERTSEAQGKAIEFSLREGAVISRLQ